MNKSNPYLKTKMNGQVLYIIIINCTVYNEYDV